MMTKEILPELLSTYENDLNFTIAHRLVNIIGGSRSLDLIAGAHCAGLIGGDEAFKRYLEAVYDIQSQGGAANSAIQEGQRADFEACVREKRWEGAFREDDAAQRRFGVTGTPTIYINGALISGADSDAMRTILDSIKAGKS
jgi:protein-disulfide isomerase